MKRIVRNAKGFTLVELAIVLVIVGLIMGTTVTIWQSSIESRRLAATKTNMENIKTAVVNYAMATGRLPCPDPTVPPNNTGLASPVAAGVCTGCAAPPCYVPFQTLQMQLPLGRDGYGNVFRYDVSYDTAGGALGGLTNSTQDTFCGVLYEYMVRGTDTAVNRAPCVTNPNDGADNAQIAAAGQGYGVAAVIVSQTPPGNTSGAPIGLTSKNVAGTAREYEMANRSQDSTYGNLVAELTFGEVFNKACGTQKTKIRIQNYTGATKYAQTAGSATCLPVVAATPTTGYIDLYQGSAVTFYTDAVCSAPCGGAASPMTFSMSATADVGTTDWSGAGTRARDGRVQMTTGNCTLSDNTNATP